MIISLDRSFRLLNCNYPDRLLIQDRLSEIKNLDIELWFGVGGKNDLFIEDVKNVYKSLNKMTRRHYTLKLSNDVTRLINYTIQPITKMETFTKIGSSDGLNEETRPVIDGVIIVIDEITEETLLLDSTNKLSDNKVIDSLIYSNSGKRQLLGTKQKGIVLNVSVQNCI